jgi:hypothetical protein
MTMTDFTSVKDSGERQEFETGARRDTQEGKPRFGLIPPYPLRRLAMHYTNGADKYGENNWTKGIPCSRTWESLERHVQSFLVALDVGGVVGERWQIVAEREPKKAGEGAKR